MKNCYCGHRLFVLFLIVFFNIFPASSQQIVQVGAGEYFTSYRTNTGRLMAAKWGNTVPVIHDFGLSNVIDVDGAQYTNVALTASGNVYVVGVTGSVNAYATLVPTDNLGQPFTGNTKVYGLYQCYLTIRNGNVWYWGIGDVLNMNGGANLNTPKQLTQPTGKTMVKLVPASATMFGGLTFLWGLASDGTVWQWDRTHTTPFQVTFPGNIAQDITMVGPMSFVVKTSSDLYAWGFDPSYAGGRPTWQQSGIQSIKAAWQSAGAVFPLKEIVGNYNTLHVIDANDNMFASGSNPQGNIGNGIQYNPWRTATTPWQWDWSNGQLMTPVTQIPGKFKNIQTSNTITFYLYVQDIGDNWYSWGRNKAMSLGNGKTLSINDYAIYPEGLNVPAPTLVTPLTQVWSITPFSSTGQQPPLSHAGVNQYINTTTTTLYGSGSSQQEGTLTSYAWSKVSGPAATIVSPNAINTQVNGLTSGTYVFRLTVVNNFGASHSSNVTVVVGTGSPANVAPVANAGNNQTITLPQSSVTLSGSGTDADGTITSIQWSKISGPATGNVVNPGSYTAIVNGLVQGVYAFKLELTDDDGAIGRDTVQVTVNPTPNQAPVVNAGSDIQITMPVNEAALEGDATDADGTIMSTNWRMITSAAGDIQDPGSISTLAVQLEPGLYEFELSATDDDGATSRDTILVLVNAIQNEAPIASAGSNQVITLPNNTVTLNGDGVDPDGNITALQWRKVAGSVANIQNPTSGVTAVTGLALDTYKFELTVTDNLGASAKDTMQITVNPAANQAPVANAGQDITLTLPANSTSLVGLGTDVDGTVVGYLWTKVSGPNVTLSNSFSSTASATTMVAGTYVFRLRVTDNNGATAVDLVTVTVLPAPNQAPNANAGSDITITLPTNSVSLNGSGTDADGTISSYNWIKLTGGAATIASANTAGTSVTGLAEGVYTFELTVTDDDGATDTDQLTVTVLEAPNQAPTAYAGLDRTITLPVNSTTLSGTSNDVDGTIASYRWTKITGPFASIANVAAASTSVTGMVEGMYVFEFRVTDNDGAIGRDTVIVTVLTEPNELPVVNAGNDQTITLPTNAVILSATATDSDGSINSYTWRKIAGSTANIANTLAATTAVTGLVQGTYRFEVAARDNDGASTKDTVQVNVLAAPNVAPTANAGTDITITLPVNSIMLNGSGVDTDGNIASYTWVKLSGGAANIANSNTASTSVTGLVQGSYSFRLTVTDNSGATATDIVNVLVLAAPNVAPTANAGTDTTITLPVNSIMLNGSGVDTDGNIASYNWVKLTGGAATITNSNSASTNVSGLAQGSYSFQLTVTDNSGANATDIVNVLVLAAPNVAPTANAGTDITITLPVNSTMLNGSGVDTDGNIASYNWIKLTGGTATITNANAASTSVTGLVQGSYSFQITVTDNSGATATDIVNVTVLAAPNVAPTANAGTDITITLPVNSIMLNGSGVDADGNIASYTWVKLSGGAATIANSNSASTNVSGLVQGSYSFQLTVTDNSGATATDIVNVTVLAAPNVAPTANAGTDITITLPVNSTMLNGSGVDTDGNIASYNWVKLSGGAATITNSNSASTNVSGLVQGSYSFQLTVTDNSGATATDIVNVTVLAAPNVAPTANAGTDITITLPVNSIMLSGSGVDTDGNIASYNWIKLTGGAANIANTNTASTSVTGLVQGSYSFQITVTDNSGATATDIVNVFVLAAPNVAPTANAGTDITITLPVNSTMLNGSGIDTDGNIASYNWVKLTGGAANIANTNSASTSVTGLVQGTYSFQLTVTDNSGATATDIVNVTVLAAPNVAPTANAGTDITITLPVNSIMLSGSGVDTDGNIASYRWIKLTGGAAIITNSNSASTSVAGLIQGSYSFQLTVTDNSGAIATDIVNVFVLAAPNVAPTANAGTDITITLPVNSIMLNGSGVDTDGNIASYNWVKLSGGAANIANTNTSSTSVTGLVQGSYSFQLTVTDNSGATATDIVNVTVLPAPNVAPMVNAGNDQVITLPVNQVTLSGSAIDADGTITSYAWVKMSGPAAFISNAASASTQVSGLSEGVYTFRLTVRDNSGATSSDLMQVTVIGAQNVAPIANAGSDMNVYLPFTTADLTGSGTDADGVVLTYNWIKITGPVGGFITNAFAASTQTTALVPGDYTFQLVVTDNDGATGRDTMIVHVMESQGNMAPVVHAGPDLTVLLPNSSVELHGTAEDFDGDVISFRWKVVSGPNTPSMNGEFRNNLVLSRLEAGMYVIELSAWDNLGTVGKDTMLLYVNSTQLTQELPKDFIRIFPNPVGPRLSIHIRTYHQGRRARLIVFDMFGRPMAEKQITISQYVNINQMDVSSLTPGWYTLKIISEGFPTVSLPLLKR